jgi:aspartyl aminopeptidase
VGNKPLLLGEKTAKKKGKKAGSDADDEKPEETKEAIKKGVLEILKQAYGIEEEDFISAELEVVPAGRAR